MSDPIERQDVIDTLTEYGSGNGIYMSVGELKRRIEALPPAQPDPQWIPCSERLPENDERVLATTAWGEVTIAERVYPSINDTCWFIHDGNTNATIDDVIAWMPLPAPYQGEGEEE